MVELKVVMLGKEACGKTSIVERYLNHRFAGENRYQATIGAAFGARKMSVEGRSVVVGVWDTAGQERYEAMSRMYYRGARAAVCCYAVNDAESWDRLQHWVAEVRRHEPDCKIYVASTKTDLLDGSNKARAVDYHNTTDFVEEIGARLFETSSKDDSGIEALFSAIVIDYLETCRSRPELLDLQTVTLQGKNKRQSSCCAKGR